MNQISATTTCNFVYYFSRFPSYKLVPELCTDVV